jgi:hypothetical protein
MKRIKAPLSFSLSLAAGLEFGADLCIPTSIQRPMRAQMQSNRESPVNTHSRHILAVHKLAYTDMPFYITN